ncbi:hypothetical protein PJ985_02595 [Streptomyces sp. ACA25]|uniref:hypothetical protein n=1 Tax=Streptomyces sp. ACA25 TaxID=3022596 RepID=UPI002307285C|nr:hypothetical protein [Streptomyces sp. ACA25]MDB1086458.1 hypothetical protein [Streptomyces sp. ACA25]
MPYETVSGGFERASRLGHTNAIVRAMAEKSDFYVPAEHLSDMSWLESKIMHDAAQEATGGRITSAIAVDGSLMVVPVRDGLPSVQYGYAQSAAVWLDITAMEKQKQERFVDPVTLGQAVNSALISYDLPVAGAYVRRGVSIKDSWRESLDSLFRSKKIEVNRMNQSLMSLLFLLHGQPGKPAVSLDVNCPEPTCGERDIAVGSAGAECPACKVRLFPTDVLRIHEEVVEDGSNESPLGRLMQVVELLVVVGLATLLWEQSRDQLFRNTLFIMDGPMAVYGPPAKLRSRALQYFQSMSGTPAALAPFICGIEKTGTVVDYAGALARHNVLAPGDLMTVDSDVISAITNSDNPIAYGAETYWGRKFIYRSTDSRTVVFTALPGQGPPYDDRGGQTHPSAYPTLPAILDVIDRTGSSMYRNGIVPVSLAHSKAAYPIGVGTDVLRLAAKQKLGLRPART